MNEYVVLVQMASTGPTTELFAVCHGVRDVAWKRSEAWLIGIGTDVH